MRAGRVSPRIVGQKTKKLPLLFPRSEIARSRLAEMKYGDSQVRRAASGGRNRRRLVGRARALHWAPAEHENHLLCDLPRYAVLADYAATCFLSSSCRCRATQWMTLGRELDRTKIRATASEMSSNDALLCCWSSSRRGLLETTTRPHPPAVFRLCSQALRGSTARGCLG